MTTINLDEIYKQIVSKNYGCSPEYIAAECMREAIRQALEMAKNDLIKARQTGESYNEANIILSIQNKVV